MYFRINKAYVYLVIIILFIKLIKMLYIGFLHFKRNKNSNAVEYIWKYRIIYLFYLVTKTTWKLI